MEYKIGDIVEFKKQHPCGSKIWEITRIGVDFKFKCKRLWSYNNGRKAKSIKIDQEKNWRYGGVND